MDGTYRQRGATPRALGLIASLALLVTACGAIASPVPATGNPSASTGVAASATPPPAVTPEPLPATGPGPNGGVVVRWFVGLGAGGQPQQLQAESEFVNAFNASQKDVYIALEIYNNNVAANILKTQIAAGNAPDIIGPVGVEGLNLFRDQLLDLEPLIAKNNYSVEGVDPKLVEFFKLGENNATVGVPFATYPSFLYFNKDLFDEAGLPYPPTKVGDMYEGKPWDMDAVRELAMKLTVDASGNDATSAGFDPANVVQWGFDMQYADNSPLAETSLFGASSFVASDGKTAQIPEQVSIGEK
jgi:multiple sugar transport system substrate-binding protein